VADGTILETKGVQAASIITTAFVRAASAMARRNGFPAYRYAMIPHPIGNLKPDQVKQRAREVLPDILAILGVETDGGESAAK